MVALNELVTYCDKLLESTSFKDYCPNGLQVEGTAEVACIVSGVTASQALIDAAITAQADLLLVHHGYFWRGESASIVGMKQRRIKALLQHNISLLAYHLPLDAHISLGNNVALAKTLGITVNGVIDHGAAKGLLFYGQLPAVQPLAKLVEHIAQSLQFGPTVVEAGDQPVQTIAWCTGGAQDFIEEAAKLNVDVYLSGEISERTTHFARENGIHYIAAGHHATERFGVESLGEHLASHFALKHQFIDVHNPA